MRIPSTRFIIATLVALGACQPDVHGLTVEITEPGRCNAQALVVLKTAIERALGGAFESSRALRRSGVDTLALETPEALGDFSWIATRVTVTCLGVGPDSNEARIVWTLAGRVIPDVPGRWEPDSRVLTPTVTLLYRNGRWKLTSLYPLVSTISAGTALDTTRIGYRFSSRDSITLDSLAHLSP